MHLTTERLVLREFEEADWPAVLAYQSDPRYLRYYRWTERTEADVRDFVNYFLANRRAEPRVQYEFAITLPPGDQLIGGCSIRLKSAGSREAEIGYELDPAHWRHGYATEAARALVAFGFQQLGLHRVSSYCIAENTASARVLEKAGLRPEGRLRENEHFKGRWWDTVLFAILDHEWSTAPQSA